MQLGPSTTSACARLIVSFAPFNATINHWLSEIRNFQFTLVHKEEKAFGPDRLSRRKGYPGERENHKFNNRMDNEGAALDFKKKTPVSCWIAI